MAVVHSKFPSLDKTLWNLDCSDIYHPWTTSCPEAWLGIIKPFSLGSARFAASLVLLQLALNARRADKKYLLDSAKTFIRFTAYLTSVGTLSLVFSCSFRKLFGKFHHYTVALVPITIAAMPLAYLLERKKRELYCLAFFSFVMEYSVRYLMRAGTLKLTKLKLCAVFMSLSSVAMYFMRCNRKLYKGISYWFFIPPVVQEPKDNNDNTKTKDCYHDGSCWKHALMDSAKYLGFGLAVGMLKPLASMFEKVFRSPAHVLRKLCSRRNTSLGVFFGSFVALYHAVSCTLFQLRARDAAWHALPAGFVAGAAFWFHPNLTFMTMMMTAGLQELMKQGLAQGIVPRSKPMFVLAFSLLCGLLFHNRIVDAELCHPFVRRLATVITARHDEKIIAACTRQKELYLL